MGKILLAICLGLFIGPAEGLKAATIVLYDLHGTIVETRAARAKNGGFPQRFILYRTFFRSSTLEPVPDGPETVEVTAAELEALEHDIAQKDGIPGSINKKVKLQNGIEIIPGQYTLKTPESFRYYHQSPEGRRYLVEALQEALKTDPSGKSWTGPLYKSMQRILSTAETAATFGLVTASAHEVAEYMDFFRVLQGLGADPKTKHLAIKFLPNPKLIFPVSRHEFDRFSLGFDSAEQKTKLLEELYFKLSRLPLSNSDLRLDADGVSQERLHSLVFADDQPGVFDRVIHKFRSLAQSKQGPVKLTIINAGTEVEVRDSGKPKVTVLTNTGRYRMGSAVESLAELFRARKLLAAGCAPKVIAAQ